MQNLLTFFFGKSMSIYARFYDQSFNDTLTNDIVCFEQLGPGVKCRVVAVKRLPALIKYMQLT